MAGLFELTGKTALVTGANRGLGRGIAVGLAVAGADIIGTSANLAPRGSAVAGEVEAAGRAFTAIPCDLSDRGALYGLLETLASQGHHVDILVNNAGIIRRCDAIDFTEKDWDEVMDVNLKTVFFFAQAAARQFIRQKTGGKIVNIASMLSFQGGIRVPSYTASKSGVMGLTRLLACEWAPHRINVNAIAPGYMATDNTAPLRADPKRSREVLDRIPAGRWGAPDDLKGVAVFLASEASSYMNGFTIAVDGGWLAR